MCINNHGACPVAATGVALREASRSRKVLNSGCSAARPVATVHELESQRRGGTGSSRIMWCTEGGKVRNRSCSVSLKVTHFQVDINKTFEPVDCG
jgi:hypothetical protein